MILRETDKFKTKDGKNRKFYGCSAFPRCKETVGAHPNGVPLGIPLTDEGKSLRIELHKMLDEKLHSGVSWSKQTREQKHMTTAWLRKNAPKSHVAEMDMVELKETLEKLKENL